MMSVLYHEDAPANEGLQEREYFDDGHYAELSDDIDEAADSWYGCRYIMQTGENIRKNLVL